MALKILVSDTGTSHGNSMKANILSFSSGSTVDVYVSSFANGVTYAINNGYNGICRATTGLTDYRIETAGFDARNAGIFVVHAHQSNANTFYSNPSYIDNIIAARGNSNSYGPGVEFTVDVGTESDATSYITGMICKLLDNHPNWSYDDARQALRESCDTYANGWNSDVGFGTVDIDVADAISIPEPINPINNIGVVESIETYISMSWKSFSTSSVDFIVSMFDTQPVLTDTPSDGTIVYEGANSHSQYDHSVHFDGIRYFGFYLSGSASRLESYSSMSVYLSGSDYSLSRPAENPIVHINTDTGWLEITDITGSSITRFTSSLTTPNYIMGAVQIGTTGSSDLVSGSLHVWNNISASSFIGNGANITGVISSSFADTSISSSFAENALIAESASSVPVGAGSYWTASGGEIHRLGNVKISGSFNAESISVANNNIITSVIHSGKMENFAGNTGLGQSKPVYFNISQSDAITGTRTSATVFTRTDVPVEWSASALVGQFAFSYTGSVTRSGSWDEITANDSGTLTINGVLHASADRIKTSLWNPIDATYAHGKGNTVFRGGVFDGESVWLVPYSSADLVKVNPSTGEMTSYTHGKGGNAFFGGVFDGENIWLVPYNADDLVKVNPSTGAMTSYVHGKGANAFAGGVFDGENIWLVPRDSDDLVKVNPSTGEMTSYTHGKGNGAFYGGVFDGENIWLIPWGSSDLVKVNPSTGEMTSYVHGKGANAFIGGVFDGENIWLVPYDSDDLVKVNPSTGVMTSYAHGKGDSAFFGGVFDGENIWLVPYISSDLVKVNPSTGEMTSYAHGKGSSAFIGGIFDGENVWLIPFVSDDLVKVRPPRFGRNRKLITQGRSEIVFASGENPTEAMRISSSGYVGIGTTTPEEQLHVWSNVSASAFYGDGSNITGVISSSYAVTSSYALYAESASYEITKEVSSSHANYATSASYANWSISSSFADTSISCSFAENATSASHAEFADTAESSSFADTSISSSFAGNAYWTASGGEIHRMGNVGIGTTNPNKHLEIFDIGNNEGGIIRLVGDEVATETIGKIEFTTDNVTYNDYTSAIRGYYPGIDSRMRQLQFITSNNYSQNFVAATIDHWGRVGIGITNPSTKLHISGTVGIETWHITDLLQIGDDYMFVSGNGNVGIGIATPTSKLHVAGNTIFGDFADDIHQFTGSVYVSSSIDVAGNVEAESLTVADNNIVTSVIHSGKMENFAGNTGLGQSKPVYFNISQSNAITGTRTSDTIFTRTDVPTEWSASVLVGQFVFSYTVGNPETGSWDRIVSNTTGSLTINGVLHASADRIKTSVWNPIDAVYAHGKGANAFFGGVFDGENIWLVPRSSADIVKVNPSTGAMTSYTHGKGALAFIGGVFDGENIWLVPLGSVDLVKVNPSTGTMTSYAHGKGATAFIGGVFDGENIWLVPYNSDDLVKVNPSTGAMTSYAHGKGATAFVGGVFDGESVWLVPNFSSDLVKVNPSTGEMTSYAHGKGSTAFQGGVFDGESIWLVPYNSDDLVKVNPSTGAMTSYAHGKGNGAFAGGIFDGESVWLVPYDSDDLVKVNPSTGAMTSYAHGKGNGAFAGGIFDGESVWLVPYSSTDLVKVRPPRFGRNRKLISQGRSEITFAVGDNPTEAMRISSSGYVGIGTTDPDAKLHVAGVISGSSISSSNGAYFGGNVGIKTPPSNYALDLLGGHIRAGSFQEAGGTIFDNNLLYFTGDSRIKISNVTKMFISKSGDIGIGTEDPDAKLHVAGDAYITGSTTFGDSADDTHQFTGSIKQTGSLYVQGNQYIGRADSSGSNRLYFYQGPNGTPGDVASIRANYGVLFFENLNGRIYLDGAGNSSRAFGIQETGSPNRALLWWFDGSSINGTGMWFETPFTAGSMNFKLGTNDGSSSFNVMDSDENVLFKVDDTGSVGIGIDPVSSGSYMLEVSGNVHIVGDIDVDGNESHFGEMFISSSLTHTQLDTQNVWAAVTASMEGGLEHGISYSGSAVLVVDKTGNYQISWVASTAAVSANKTYQIGLSINLANPNPKTIIERRYSSNDVGASAGQATLNMNAGDSTCLMVRNLTDTTNIIIKFANVQVHKL